LTKGGGGLKGKNYFCYNEKLVGGPFAVPSLTGRRGKTMTSEEKNTKKPRSMKKIDDLTGEGPFLNNLGFKIGGA